VQRRLVQRPFRQLCASARPKRRGESNGRNPLVRNSPAEPTSCLQPLLRTDDKLACSTHLPFYAESQGFDQIHHFARGLFIDNRLHCSPSSLIRCRARLSVLGAGCTSIERHLQLRRLTSHTYIHTYTTYIKPHSRSASDCCCAHHTALLARCPRFLASYRPDALLIFSCTSRNSRIKQWQTRITSRSRHHPSPPAAPTHDPNPETPVWRHRSRPTMALQTLLILNHCQMPWYQPPDLAIGRFHTSSICHTQRRMSKRFRRI
jgi:hypothetical protein